MSFLADIGRGQIDRNPFSVRAAKGAVGNGGGDPVLALFDRGVRQPAHRDLIGITPSGVDFDFHLKRLDTNDRSRTNLRWQKGSRNTLSH
jgi:hypothetical protein